MAISLPKTRKRLPIMGKDDISPAQIRAAMALLKWENEELAAAAGIGTATAFTVKTGKHQPQPRIRAKIRAALEREGIEFTDFDGVRRRPQDIEVFIGIDRFQEFTEFVYQYLVKNGGDVCISADDETQFQKYRRNVKQYREHMTELVKRGDVTVRILASESTFIPLFTQMKWQPRASASPTSFYAFGACLALISFDYDPAPYVVLHKTGPFAAAYRQAFNAAWANAKDPSERPK